ncbi:ornithine cyclodeaminase family protein [Haloarchaeobius amylolyticus]|uniref:Ornithine cyclodeaminase family protein n=1 Tax=Haloarchaeobius amylolyticus TaxID=1198296 RepID=A0ABD6BDH7_9EURY
MSTKLFSEGDVQRRLDFDHALELAEQTYRELAQGRVVNPPKLGMHMGDDGEWPDLNAFAIDMPAYVDWLDVAGVKWAVANWDLETGTPISSLILLFDLEEGRFKSILEGMYITGVRTAIQSVVGLQHLRPSRPAEIGVLGAGYQARFQLQVIDELLDVDTFYLYDIDDTASRSLATSLDPRTDAEIVVCDTPAATAQSDAILTVTNSKTPVLSDDALDGSELIIALGTYQELSDRTILDADHVIVDHVEQCFQRGALSDLVDRNELTRSDVDATIGDVIDGGYDGRIQGDDRVVFTPIGLGSIDVAIAEHVYRNGTEDVIGEEFNFV